MKQSRMYDAVQGVYRSFFKNKEFKELKKQQSKDCFIYEIWFKDTYGGGKPCEYSHNIVILK